jgi:hypothetical protein
LHLFVYLLMRKARHVQGRILIMTGSFIQANANEAKDPSFDDASWRSLDLPHDRSIELPFDFTSPTGNGRQHLGINSLCR